MGRALQYLVIEGVTIEPIGIGEAACPSCGITLAKFPVRRAKCKACGEDYYVRTQPFDGTKRILKERDLVEHALQSQAFYDYKALLRLAHDSPAIQAMRKDMDERFGQAVIDQRAVEAYFLRPPTKLLQAGRDPVVRDPSSKRVPLWRALVAGVISGLRR